MEPANSISNPPKQNRLKRFFKILFIITFVLFALAVSLGYIFEDKIEQMVVSSINSRLKIEVKVKDIHFSFIRKFPQASLQFDQILARPCAPFSKQDTLLYADKLFLMFDIKEIFAGRYNLIKAEINDATLNLITNKKGEINYEI